MERKFFKDFNVDDFWDDTEYSLNEYIEEYPTDDLINSIEQELGYKLPASYIELMKLHNGGTPKNCCFPTSERTSWAENHIAITGILGIGRSKPYSLCGSLGSKFMTGEWGYPDTGVYICVCPSSGHDMVMLDYSKCGPAGEPEVVHVDQEWDYKKTFLANDFETFVLGLVSDDVFDTSEQDLRDTLESFTTGRFSDILEEYFKKEKEVNFDKVLRNLFTTLTKEKGYFALHADPLSHLAYGIQFYLLSINKKIETKERFVEEYPLMVAMGNNEITTGGYANFFEDWFDERLKLGDIRKSLLGSYQFSPRYQKTMFEEVKKYE